MLSISIKNDKQHYSETGVNGAAVLGRRTTHPDARSIVVDDLYVSRAHLRVDPRESGSSVLLTNVSDQLDVQVDYPEKVKLGPQDRQEFTLPVKLRLGRSTAEIRLGPHVGTDSSDGLTTIGAPIHNLSERRSVLGPGDSPSSERLIKWFETLITVQKSAAGSDEFYQQTAQAVVDMVQLDCGMVLLRSGNKWKPVAQHSADWRRSVEYSEFILAQVVEQRRTFFRLDTVDVTSGSLMGVGSVVASPIFDPKSDEVVGAVYGARHGNAGTGEANRISPLEAQLVQVLAAAVGSGLARKHEEAEAARRHVQFEQFVSPEVVSELDRNPDLLAGIDSEITVLFADIRNFSTMSERLGARKLCELVRFIMERLTHRVREHSGTTVSYLGDGLLAMWNAPVEQEDHSVRACRAALAMAGDLPVIDAEWSEIVGGPLGIGIGINTGTAMVGNTGSQLKPQYGPLGDTVNLASRVEGVTKKLGIPILLTGTTRRQIGDSFATRRLCSVRVVGKTRPVDLFELHAETATAEWKARRDQFESALNLFESGQWNEACSTAFPLLRNADGSNDGPSLCLISRSVECLNDPPDAFDPVWNLMSK